MTGIKVALFGQLRYLRKLFSDKNFMFYIMYFLSIVPPAWKFEKFEDVRTLKAGTATVMELPFNAHPMPDVEWTFKDEPISDKRFQEETIYGLTCLRLKKVVRSDSGDYVVTVTNPYGECSLTVKVIVIG